MTLGAPVSVSLLAEVMFSYCSSVGTAEVERDYAGTVIIPFSEPPFFLNIVAVEGVQSMSMVSKTCAAAVTALLGCALPSTAIAQERSCISRAESQAVVAHLMPNLVDSVSKRCDALLADQMFTARDAARLSERLAPLAQRSWPAARSALERQSGSPLPASEAILKFGRIAIADGVADGMDSDTCRIVDQLLVELAPLPAGNFANVFALFLEAGMNSDPDSALRVCENRTDR